MLLNLQDLREDYQKDVLDVSTIAENPFHQFERWFSLALEAKIPEPNAMTLSTVTSRGRPSARIVLLKGFDEKGFVFYTNYQSRKGRELSQTPYASLLFCWLSLHKQIRIEGSVEKIAEQESTKYFQSRPKGSQIGAWASPQSQVIEKREILEEKVKELEKKISGSRYFTSTSSLGRLPGKTRNDRVLARPLQSLTRSYPLYLASGR